MTSFSGKLSISIPSYTNPADISLPESRATSPATSQSPSSPNSQFEELSSNRLRSPSRPASAKMRESSLPSPKSPALSSRVDGDPQTLADALQTMRVRKNREPGLTDFLELLGDRPPTIANLGKVPPLKLDEKSQAEITSFMNKTVGTLSLDNFRISAIVLSHAHPDIHRDNGMSTLGSALPRLAPENQQTGFEEIFKHIAPYAPVSRAPALKSLAVNVLKSPIPYSPDSLKYASGNFTKVLNAMDGMSGAEKKPILEALAGPLPFHGFTDEGWQPRFNEIVSATHGMTPEQYGHVLGVLDEQLKTIEQFFPQQKEAVDASRRAIELRRSRFDLGE